MKQIKTENILLPGGNKQFEHLLEQKILNGNNALIIGSGCEQVAVKLLDHFESINIISDEYDFVMQSRILLRGYERIKISMMEYAHTDFESGKFDLVYAQGSLSIPDKKEIIKEIKRILSPAGILCSGEIVSLKETVPTFVSELWERSGLEPIYSQEIKKSYEDRGFEVLAGKDLSETLKDFYTKILNAISKMSKEEKEEDKKYFLRMKHESNAYLKLGGDKYIGFKSLVMRKSN